MSVREVRLAVLGAPAAGVELSAPDVSGLEFVETAVMEEAAKTAEVALSQEHCVVSDALGPGSDRADSSHSSST